jgi:hypothetical protein
MFERIKRHLAGVLHPITAERQCRAWFDNSLTNLKAMELDEQTNALLSSAKFKSEFYSYLGDTCTRCLSITDRKVQKINLRREVVARTEEMIMAETYLSKPIADRQILSDRVFFKRSREENDKYFQYRKTFSAHAALIVRQLAGTHFDDYRRGDWFVVLNHSARLVVRYKLDNTILAAKGDALGTVVEAALRTFEQNYRNVEQVVFDGGNYDVNPADYAERPTADEPPPKERSRIKRTAVYADEIDKLVAIFSARLSDIANGRLYRYEPFVPKELFRCVVVDAALLWTRIGMKLDDPQLAKTYVAEIVGRSFERLANDSSSGEDYHNLLSEAEVLAEHHIKAEGEGWFASFLVFAFSYIYDVAIDNSPAKKEQNRHVGSTAFGLGNHIWPLFADVSEVLGDEVSRSWFDFDNDQSSSPTEKAPESPKVVVPQLDAIKPPIQLREAKILFRGHPPGIVEPDDIAKLRRARVLREDGTDVVARLVNKSGQKIFVGTVEECQVAETLGFFPSSTFDMMSRAYFDRAGAILSACQIARKPERSYLVPISRVDLLPARCLSMFRDAAGDHRPNGNVTIEEMRARGDCTLIDATEISITIEIVGMRCRLTELLRADVTGDGLEDVLIWQDYPDSGSHYRPSAIVLTRLSDTLLFTTVSPPTSEMSATAVATAAALGLRGSGN